MRLDCKPLDNFHNSLDENTPVARMMSLQTTSLYGLCVSAINCDGMIRSAGIVLWFRDKSVNWILTFSLPSLLPSTVTVVIVIITIAIVIVFVIILIVAFAIHIDFNAILIVTTTITRRTQRI